MGEATTTRLIVIASAVVLGALSRGHPRLLSALSSQGRIERSRPSAIYHPRASEAPTSLKWTMAPLWGGYRRPSNRCTEARGRGFGYFLSANANQLREICTAL